MPDEQPKEKLYPQDPSEGFGNGACLDLRVRLAINLLKDSRLFQGHALVAPPDDLAKIALEIANRLLNRALERGWISDLPRDGELSQQARNHAARTASFGVLQQIEGQRFAKEEAARVIPAAPFAPPPRSGTH